MLNHSQTIGGDTAKLLHIPHNIPPIPPLFRHPCFHNYLSITLISVLRSCQ